MDAAQIMAELGVTRARRAASRGSASYIGCSLTSVRRASSSVVGKARSVGTSGRWLLASPCPLSRRRNHPVPNDLSRRSTAPRLCPVGPFRHGAASGELWKAEAEARAGLRSRGAASGPTGVVGSDRVASSFAGVLAVAGAASAPLDQGREVADLAPTDQAYRAVALHPCERGRVERPDGKRLRGRIADDDSVGNRGVLRVPGGSVVAVRADAEGGARLQAERLFARVARRAVVSPGVLPVRMRSAA